MLNKGQYKSYEFNTHISPIFVAFEQPQSRKQLIEQPTMVSFVYNTFLGNRFQIKVNRTNKQTHIKTAQIHSLSDDKKKPVQCWDRVTSCTDRSDSPLPLSKEFFSTNLLEVFPIQAQMRVSLAQPLKPVNLGQSIYRHRNLSSITLLIESSSSFRIQDQQNPQSPDFLKGSHYQYTLEFNILHCSAQGDLKSVSSLQKSI